MVRLRETMQVAIEAETGELETDLRRGEQAVDRFARNSERDIRRLSAASRSLRTNVRGILSAFGAFGVGFGLAQALRQSLDVSRSFTQALSTVRAVTGATEGQFLSLTEEARRLGETTRFSAEQAANGMLALARAGFTVQETLVATNQVLLLAQAGGLELGRAAEIAANTLRQFNFHAEETARIADVLALAANSSNTTVNTLGEALAKVGPIANVAGVEFETVVAAIARLGNVGVPAADAGTALRNTMIRLSNFTPVAIQALDRLGLTVDDVRLSTNEFVDVMELLRQRGAGAVEIFEIFGQRLVSPISALAAGTDFVRQLNAELEDSQNTVQRVATIMDDNLNGAVLRLNSRWEELLISLGEDTGVFRGIVDGLASLVGALNVASDEVLSTENAIQALRREEERLVELRQRATGLEEAASNRRRVQQLRLVREETERTTAAIASYQATIAGRTTTQDFSGQVAQLLQNRLSAQEELNEALREQRRIESEGGGNTEALLRNSSLQAQRFRDDLEDANASLAQLTGAENLEFGSLDRAAVQIQEVIRLEDRRADAIRELADLQRQIGNDEDARILRQREVVRQFDEEVQRVRERAIDAIEQSGVGSPLRLQIELDLSNVREQIETLEAEIEAGTARSTGGRGQRVTPEAQLAQFRRQEASLQDDLQRANSAAAFATLDASVAKFRAGVEETVQATSEEEQARRGVFERRLEQLQLQLATVTALTAEERVRLDIEAGRLNVIGEEEGALLAEARALDVAREARRALQEEERSQRQAARREQQRIEREEEEARNAANRAQADYSEQLLRSSRNAFLAFESEARFSESLRGLGGVFDGLANAALASADSDAERIDILNRLRDVSGALAYADESVLDAFSSIVRGTADLSEVLRGLSDVEADAVQSLARHHAALADAAQDSDFSEFRENVVRNFRNALVNRGNVDDYGDIADNIARAFLTEVGTTFVDRMLEYDWRTGFDRVAALIGSILGEEVEGGIRGFVGELAGFFGGLTGRNSRSTSQVRGSLIASSLGGAGAVASAAGSGPNITVNSPLTIVGDVTRDSRQNAILIQDQNAASAFQHAREAVT